MAFLHLTLADDSNDRYWVNTDHIVWFHNAEYDGTSYCVMQIRDDRDLTFRESADDVWTMIEKLGIDTI